MTNPAPLLALVPDELSNESQINQLTQNFDDLPEVLKPTDLTRISQVAIKETRDLITTKIVGVISRDFGYLDQEGIKRSFSVSYFSREYNPLIAFINADSKVAYQESLYPPAIIAKLGYDPLPNKFSKIYKLENPDGFSFELDSEEADTAIISKFKDGNLFSTITITNGKIISEVKI